MLLHFLKIATMEKSVKYLLDLEPKALKEKLK